MKKVLWMVLGLLSVSVMTGCRTVSVPASHTATAEERAAMEQTCQFLKDAGHYFLATVDVDQPRVRPFGTANIFEGRLYIQTGRKKQVARQLLANGKAELCALKGDKWIRIAGELIDDPRVEAKRSMLDAHPSLKSMYKAEDENTMVLYFRPGSVTATIYSFKGAPVVLRF